MAPKRPSRRALLRAGGTVGLTFLAGTRAAAAAASAQADAAVAGFFGAQRPVQAGRVVVEVPAISENGFSVPLAVAVDSPMTESDFVRRILVVSERNPLPVVARFELGPLSGRASVQTRIRLADSQRVRAVAEMSDGSLWGGYGHSIVTLAACVL